jgi:hypothetical protein
MIELKDHRGNDRYFAPGAIAEIQEASASSQWHGIHAIVRTFDGQTVEVRNAASEVVRLIREARG